MNNTDRNFVVEDSSTSIKATVRGRKKWGLFLPSVFVFVVQAFCVLPILGFALFTFLHEYFSEFIQGIVMLVAFCLYLYLLYKKLLETAEYAFDHEVVKIDDHSITVEKSGFLFLKTRKTFLAENIKGIISSSYIREQFSILNRIPFGASNFGAFMISENRPFKPMYNFGNNVSQANAESFLESVYKKFPKYRYTDTT